MEILREILVEALTVSSSASALATLQALARDTNYEAIQALSQALAHELGCDTPASSFINARSLPELLATADILPLLRIYAAGFSPRDFISNIEALGQLAADVRQEEVFSRFQHLVRRGSLLQDEVLRAYVLAAFVDHSDFSSQIAGYSSPANLLTILYKINTECRIVPGSAAETGLTFGRDLIVDLASADRLLGIIMHEFGHLFTNEAFARPVQRLGVATAQTEQQPSTHQQLFLEIVRSLPELLDAALRLASQPMQPLVLRSQLAIIYSHVALPRGQYTHVSLSDRGRGIDLGEAAVYSYFILLMLGVDPWIAAAAYSPRGVFHFGFPRTGPDVHLLKRKVQGLDVGPAIENARANSTLWLDELEKSGRLGRAEEDVRVALGLESRRPIYYGTAPEGTLQDLSTCWQLRANGIPATTTSDQLNRLLCSAVRCADVPVVRALLEAGAQPDAHAGGNEACALRAGASLCIIDDGKGKTYYGPTDSDILTVVDTLHAFGLDLNGPIDSEENTLLIDAAGRSLELTQFLLVHGASPNQPNRRSEMPLLTAASWGSTKVVEALLHHGARVAEHDNRGKTALHTATDRGREDVVSLLLEHGADTDAADHEGETPLMAASSAAIVELLLQAGAAVDAATPNGMTALMRAARRGLPAVVKVLLEGGADPSATTSLGETAIHFATFPEKAESQCASLQALLEAGADVDEQTNEGMTPLMFASAWGHVEAVEMLIARGPNVNARTVGGDTALIVASAQLERPSRDPTFYSDIEQAIRILARAGADLNAVNDLGFTALHYATLCFYSTAVKAFLELGANVNVRTREGVTPLAHAAAHAHPDMVQSLIAAGADVNMADNEGNTPLHLALGADSKYIPHMWHEGVLSDPEKNKDVAKQLIQAGASITCRNLAGDTPLSLAKSKNAWKSIQQMINDA